LTVGTFASVQFAKPTLGLFFVPVFCVSNCIALRRPSPVACV